MYIIIVIVLIVLVVRYAMKHTGNTYGSTTRR